MRDVFLGDDRVQSLADPERDPVAWVTWPEGEVPVLRCAAPRKEAVAEVGRLLPRLALSAILLLTLIWGLFLGQAATVKVLGEMREARPPEGSVKIATETCSTPACPQIARLAKNRHRGHLSVALHFPRARLSDPLDDEASEDPTDDDDGDWENPTADDNSSESAIAWLPELVCYLTCSEVGVALVWPETSSPPFLTPLRLRC
jgi:hypothetical protein